MSETAIRLGLRENWRQFWLLVLVNAFVGAMVGLERTILPLIAEQEFGMVARGAILSFIVTFGFVKAGTNFFAGRLGDIYGRKKVLLAGWLFGIPVPLRWRRGFWPTGSGWFQPSRPVGSSRSRRAFLSLCGCLRHGGPSRLAWCSRPVTEQKSAMEGIRRDSLPDVPAVRNITEQGWDRGSTSSRKFSPCGQYRDRVARTHVFLRGLSHPRIGHEAEMSSLLRFRKDMTYFFARAIEQNHPFRVLKEGSHARKAVSVRPHVCGSVVDYGVGRRHPGAR